MCRTDTDGPVIPVARFRPFGRRPDGSEAREPDPWLDDPPPRPVESSVPATRAAAPAMWAPRPVEPVGEDLAPVTDPFGFPPVPPVVGGRDEAAEPRDAAPAWAAWVPERGASSAWGASVRSDRGDSPMVGSPSAADTAGSARAAGPADLAGSVDPGDPDEPADPVGARRGAGIDRAATDRAESDRAESDRAESDRSGPPGRSGSGCRPEASRWEPVRAASGSTGSERLEPAPADPLPDPAEAAALAGAFAADYLSWDEDDPARRGRALSDHLPGPPAGHALLGWSGAGRQRADIVLPGAVRPDGDGRLLVDVRVRVTPYRRVSRSEATPEPDPRDALGTPAAAPSVTARGWRGLAARWVRLGVTVVIDGDRLVVDAGEESFDEPDAPRPPVPSPPRSADVGRAGGPAEDPTLDGDDVVAAGSRR